MVQAEPMVTVVDRAQLLLEARVDRPGAVVVVVRRPIQVLLSEEWQAELLG